MKFGVLGTGQVGSTIGRKLQALGHDVVLGSRTPASEKAERITVDTGIRVQGYAEAAGFGEWIVNALPGEQSLPILSQCPIDGKILIDIGNYDSAVDSAIVTPLGEALQKAFPGARLVKTLNSVSAHLMTDPQSLGKDHHVFMAGNDEGAKAEVRELLETFGWRSILDLGDLTACRAMEQLIPLWMRLEAKFGDPKFNLAVMR